MARDKALFQPESIDIFFSFLHKKNVLWYLLVASYQGASNESPQHNIIFTWESKKNIGRMHPSNEYPQHVFVEK